jgi:hypothetical protein
MARSRSFSDWAFVLAGPVVWAAHFFLLYGAEALLCTGPGAAARGGQLLPLAAALTAAAVACLLGIVAWQFRFRRRARRATEGIAGTLFWRDAPTALAGLAMLAVLWVAYPAMLLPACAPPA